MCPRNTKIENKRLNRIILNVCRRILIENYYVPAFANV